MNSLRNIVDRLSGNDHDHANLVAVMAAVIPDDIGLSDDVTLISYLSANGFLAKEIYDCLDDVIARLRVNRRRDAILSGAAGAFMFAALFIATGVATLIPTCAQAAVLTPAGEEAYMKLATALGVFVALCIGVGLLYHAIGRIHIGPLVVDDSPIPSPERSTETIVRESRGA